MTGVRPFFGKRRTGVPSAVKLLPPIAAVTVARGKVRYLGNGGGGGGRPAVAIKQDKAAVGVQGGGLVSMGELEGATVYAADQYQVAVALAERG
jgi:hypothetical protein